MHNPFAESVGGDSDDVELVRQAKSGDRDSLERLVLRHQAWIYNIAVRMVFEPQDAEEVTQEVLVKAVHSPEHVSRREQVSHLAVPYYGESCTKHETPWWGRDAAQLLGLRGCYQ